MKLGLATRTSAIALTASLALPGATYAQSAVDVLRDTIVVTGTKKKNAENVQEVPLAVTAYGGDTQLPGTLGGGTFSPLAKGRVVGIELQLATT